MYTVKPIGRVDCASFEEEIKTIEVFPEYEAALEGMDQLDACLVLFWMHGLKEEELDQLKVHPRRDESRPRRGVFATRSPVRPNPIGVTRVELVSIEGRRLRVRGLDAYPGSPIIDIKAAD